MSSARIATIVTMIETLPDNLQDKLVEHIREFITDLDDEARWESSFDRTRSNLVAAARKAKQEITQNKAVPMDYEQL